MGDLFKKEIREILEPTNLMFMCHWGSQRSAGIQAAYKEAGKHVDIFPKGSAGLNKLRDDQVESIIGDRKLLFIFDGGSKETGDFEKASDTLNRLRIPFIIIDSMALNIKCYELTGRELNEFML